MGNHDAKRPDLRGGFEDVAGPDNGWGLSGESLIQHLDIRA
jgi:hypothetical protein